MDKKLMAHLTKLSRSELTAKASRMGDDIIDDLEELSELVDEDDVDTIERAIREIKTLRVRLASAERGLV
jgi:hypothetical protein